MVNVRGQGAFEYLLIIGGCVLVAAIVMMIMQGTANQANGAITGGTNDFVGFLNNMRNVSN